MQAIVFSISGILYSHVAKGKYSRDGYIMLEINAGLNAVLTCLLKGDNAQKKEFDLRTIKKGISSEMISSFTRCSHLMDSYTQLFYESRLPCMADIIKGS